MLGLPIVVLLILSVCSSATVSVCCGLYARKFDMSGSALWRYTFVQCTVVIFAIALVFLSSGSSFVFSFYSIICGIVFAVALILSTEFSLKAQSSGSFSYTLIIVALSAIIPTLSGLFLFNENIIFTQYIGIVLMVLCIILSPESKNNKFGKANVKWLFYCMIAFITTGAIGVIQKVHQSSAHKNEMPSLLLISFFISAIYSGIKLFSNKKYNREKAVKTNKKEYIIPIVSGFMLAFPHTINLFLSGRLPAVVFFPIVNLCPLIITTLYAFIIYKEKLSLKRTVGLIMGFLSTILVSGIIK